MSLTSSTFARARSTAAASASTAAPWEQSVQAKPTRELAAIAAWRDAPYFTAPERAALALTEHVTSLADSPDPVPDDIWDEAPRHFDERGMAALLLSISVTNVLQPPEPQHQAGSRCIGLVQGLKQKRGTNAVNGRGAPATTPLSHVS